MTFSKLQFLDNFYLVTITKEIKCLQENGKSDKKIIVISTDTR